MRILNPILVWEGEHAGRNYCGYGQPYQSIVLKTGVVGIQVTLDILIAALGLSIGLWMIDT